MASVKGKKNRIYTDIDLSFGVNAFSGDLNKKLDVNAVKQSIKTLLLTQSGEKPFHPEIGSNLRGMLFENITPQISHMISKLIEKLIINYEPRAQVIQVITRPNLDRNAYQVTLSFRVLNHPEPVTIESFLERLR